MHDFDQQEYDRVFGMCATISRRKRASEGECNNAMGYEDALHDYILEHDGLGALPSMSIQQVYVALKRYIQPYKRTDNKKVQQDHAEKVLGKMEDVAAHSLLPAAQTDQERLLAFVYTSPLTHPGMRSSYLRMRSGARSWRHEHRAARAFDRQTVTLWLCNLYDHIYGKDKTMDKA